MVELYPGDVFEPDKHVAAAVNDRFPKRLQVVVAADRSQQVAPLAALDLAAGYVLVAAPDRVAHIADGQAPVRQPRCIDENLDLPLGTAPDVDLGHAGHAGQAGTDVVFDEVPHHVHIETTRIAFLGEDRVVHERVRRERAGEHARLVDVDRVRRHLVERVIDANQRLGDIDAERKVELDRCAARRRRCFEPRQVRDIAQVFFLLDQDFFLDVLRRCAGPRGLHRDRAHLEIGDHLHRHPERRQHAEHADDQRGDCHQDAVAYDGFEHVYRPRPFTEY